VNSVPEGSWSRRTRRWPSARSCHTPDSFRPCRSSRLRRFAPLNTLQVYCTLHPTMGFTTFQILFPASHGGAREERPHARSLSTSCEAGGVRRRCSATRSNSEELVWPAVRDCWLTQLGDHPRWCHTLRSFSLADSRSTSPWPLPSRRCSRIWLAARNPSREGRARTVRLGQALDLKALLHRRIRCAVPTLPPRRRPMLPWASLPFQDL
jgi:hypothetical protein